MIGKLNLLTVITSALILAVASSSAFAADSVYEALSSGKATGNFNFRYEGVSQDNTVKDANAFTLRTRLGYTTSELKGWSVSL